MTTWERLLRWEDAHRWTVDALAAAVTLLVAVPLSVAVLGMGTGTGASVWATLLVAPLAWRRTHPVASAATVYTVALAHVLVGVPFVFPADLAVLVALYSITVHGPRWGHRVAMLGALAGGLLVVVVLWPASGAGAAFLAVLVVTSALAAWAFGLARRSRRERIDALVDRAERLERERDQQAAIATAAERARIAREMHDIVAHSLSVVIAQADGGRYAAQSDPPAATRALETIAETGRAALTDMRRLLGVLRSETGAPGPADTAGPGVLPAQTSPQPGAGDISGLVEQVRAGGAHISLVRLGTPRLLPPGVGLALYRIAQEALTNVLKHAGPGPRVTVLLQWRADAVELEVTDDGRGASVGTDGLGQGLLGMHERATMFGGTVTTGPRPGGGYRVRARLPVPASAPVVTADDEPDETLQEQP